MHQNDVTSSARLVVEGRKDGEEKVTQLQKETTASLHLLEYTERTDTEEAEEREEEEEGQEGLEGGVNSLR